MPPILSEKMVFESKLGFYIHICVKYHLRLMKQRNMKVWGL